MGNSWVEAAKRNKPFYYFWWQWEHREMQSVVTRLHSASFLNQRGAGVDFWAVCLKGKCLNREGETGAFAGNEKC